MRRRTLLVAFATSVAGLIVAGCGSSSKPSMEKVSTKSAVKKPAVSLPKLTLNLSEAAITVEGSKQSGAVNVISTETGLHEASAVLFRLRPEVSFAEVESFLKLKGPKSAGADPNNASNYGSIVFDVEATEGKGNETQTELEAGNYLALVPGGEGKDPTAYTKFTVAQASPPAALQQPGATIRSIEFGFRGPKTLHDGEVVRFENEGFLVHMDLAFPVASMAAAHEAVKDLLIGTKAKEKEVEKLVVGPPAEFAGPVSHEAFQQETIAAKPGIYVELCLMDTQDDRQHTQLGMERIITIKQ